MANGSWKTGKRKGEDERFLTGRQPSAVSRQSFFLDLDSEAAGDPAAPYAVLPLPYERTVTYGAGTVRAPAAILRASREIDDFDEELMASIDLTVQTLPAPALDGLSDENALAAIRKVAEGVLRERRFLLALGGEHTVTGALTAAAKDVFGPLTVLHIDAHLDLREHYQGTPYSHACVMKRVRDMALSTVHVGARSCSAGEYAYAEKNRIAVFWARDILADRDNRWIGRVVGQLAGNVYVTVDADAFDPSLVPGTGTPEPGGLFWRHVTFLLREVFRSREVVAADIVEVAPVPGSQVSEFVAARLGAKMLMYHKQRKTSRRSRAE